MENWWISKNSVFLSPPISRVACMALDLYDYHGFQLKITPAQTYAKQCIFPNIFDCFCMDTHRWMTSIPIRI